MKTLLSKDHTITQTKGNLVSDMNGEKVMMSIGSGKYYNLGHVGSRIWELIENPVSINQIVSQLLSEYDVNEEDCEQQVISFLTLLSSEGLIEVATQ